LHLTNVIDLQFVGHYFISRKIVSEGIVFRPAVSIGMICDGSGNKRIFLTAGKTKIVSQNDLWVSG
jgi:hypothetical protein